MYILQIDSEAINLIRALIYASIDDQTAHALNEYDAIDPRTVIFSEHIDAVRFDPKDSGCITHKQFFFYNKTN